MFAGLYAKLIGAFMAMTLLAGLFLWGHCVGAGGVQAKWDAAKLAQSTAVVIAQSAADTKYDVQQTKFSALGATYEATTHAQVPAVADSIAAGITGGTVQLRDKPALCPTRGTVSAATASSRAADAAATQALADRVANSIAAVRAGDAADARERQLDAQVIGLQAILAAERKP